MCTCGLGAGGKGEWDLEFPRSAACPGLVLGCRGGARETGCRGGAHRPEGPCQEPGSPAQAGVGCGKRGGLRAHLGKATGDCGHTAESWVLENTGGLQVVQVFVETKSEADGTGGEC